MRSVQIEKYRSENYAEVNRIFSESTKEHVNNGIQLGLRNQTIQGLLALAFSTGYFCFSWFHACLFLLLAFLLQVLSVFACYYPYVWQATDMNDKELKFWTTKPNTFLVRVVHSSWIWKARAHSRIEFTYSRHCGRSIAVLIWDPKSFGCRGLTTDGAAFII